MRVKGKLRSFRVLLQYDLVHGCDASWKYILLCAGLFLILGISYIVEMRNVFAYANIESPVGLLDQWVYIFRGQLPPGQAVEQMILPEPGWLVVQIMPIFLVLLYPTRDLYDGGGRNILIRSKSRAAWWFSKNIWSWAMVFLYYLGLFLVCTGISLLAGGGLISDAAMVHTMGRTLDVSAGNLFICFFSPIISALVHVSLELLISVVWSPFFALLVILTVHLMAVYWQVPILVGNISMFYRSCLFQPDGGAWGAALAVSGVLIVVCLLIGIACVRRKDILSKGDLK